MNIKSCPLVLLYGYRSGNNELSFVGRKGTIVFNGRTRKVTSLLRLCNGLNSIEEICHRIRGMKINEALELLSICESNGIVSDSREIYKEFHFDTSNPMKFTHDIGAEDVELISKMSRVSRVVGESIILPSPELSRLYSIVSKRKSVRHFSNDSLDDSHLTSILQVMYGTTPGGHWTVPSGGALYPLDIYVIVMHTTQSLRRGVYRWIPENQSLEVLSIDNPSLWVNKVFNASSILVNSSYVLCISADFRRVTMKYGNRAYRNVHIEAGHAAQNAYLYCAEKDIGIVEYLGFNDGDLANRLGLDVGDKPVLSTLIIGTPEHKYDGTVTDDQITVEKSWLLRKALVGKDKPITHVSFWDPKVGSYSMPKWIAVAGYQPPNKRKSIAAQKRCSAFATGTTSSEAALKCIAEGYERYAWEQYRAEIIRSLEDMTEDYCDPRIYAPFRDCQFDLLRTIKPFKPSAEVGWVRGWRMNNGKDIWIPSDLVFSASKRPSSIDPFFLSSSNGVAAHFDRTIAMESALYELVERDAFCVTWYAKRKVKKVRMVELPDQQQERIEKWQSMGYKVAVLDLTLDGPPVALVMIWNPLKTPAFLSGGGCRSNFTDACNKAFDEAEFMAVTWYRRRIRRIISKTQIISPDDHGLFYSNPKKLVHLQWLLDSVECSLPQYSFDGDWSKFDPVIVDITPSGNNSGLVVIRAFSRYLMQINFGFGTEHYRHQRLKMLNLDWRRRYPSIPHFFA